MSDDAQGTASAATQPTEGTAPPATAQGDGASLPAAPTGGEAAPASQDNADDIWAKVLELDPEELIRKYPKLQGKVGSLAQQQTQREIQRLNSEWEQRRTADLEERAKQQRRAELRQLATSDPDALAARVVTDLTQEELQDRDRRRIAQVREEHYQQLAGELNSFYRKPIVEEVWAQADADTRAKLTWTNYNDIPSFLEAAADIISDYRSEKKASAKAESLAKQRLEALQKEAKIEAVQADAQGKTDLNLDGLSSGTRIFTRAEIQAMSLEEYRKNASAIMAQSRAGYIK
jgi:hypothetical protein